MTKQLDIVLHTDHSPESCLSKLSGQIDVDRWTLFSLSGYSGNKPMLGRIIGNEFRLHKRRYWRNSFAPVLFGRVALDGVGTLIEAYWSTWRWPRLYFQLWLGLATVIGIPILAGALRDVIHGKSLRQDNLWLGFVVPIALVLTGVLIPRIGAALSFHERKNVAKFLERTVMAGQTPLRNQERTWKTSLDGRWG